MSTSTFPSFHKLSVQERVRTVRDRGLLSSQDYKALVNGETILDLSNADAMIENVIGVMGVPVGLGVNFLINGKDHVVPLAVEEPSIVAALSFAAKTARAAGGFSTSSSDPILIGQIQLVDVPHPSKARQLLEQRKEEVLNLANSLHPRMVARGGGAVDLEVILHPATNDSVEMLVAHLLVDTRDAMGANLVNTMCEGVASFIESITGGKVFLRILSNLADRSLVGARVDPSIGALASKVTPDAPLFGGDAVVGLDLSQQLQRVVAHLLIQGVELVGAVEDHQRDGAATLDQQGFIGAHGAGSLRKRGQVSPRPAAPERARAAISSSPRPSSRRIAAVSSSSRRVSATRPGTSTSTTSPPAPSSVNSPSVAAGPREPTTRQGLPKT